VWDVARVNDRRNAKYMYCCDTPATRRVRQRRLSGPAPACTKFARRTRMKWTGRGVVAPSLIEAGSHGCTALRGGRTLPMELESSMHAPSGRSFPSPQLKMPEPGPRR
jgi:hypothetical protein